MKIYNWINILNKLSENKHIFSVPELANIADSTLSYARKQIFYLKQKGIIFPVYHGIYGYGKINIEEVISAIDHRAYLTADTILYENNIILQKPNIITCFSSTYHGRTRIKNTTIGKIIFHKIRKNIYLFPEKTLKATSEQALLDFIYISLKKGIDPLAKVKFQKSSIKKLNKKYLDQIIKKYPHSVKLWFIKNNFF